MNSINSPAQSTGYRHPGQVFIQQQGLPTNRDSVLAYAQFLRVAAGLTDQPPIDLAAIYRCFGMTQPLRVPLVDQQGILVDGSTGLILIKADDAMARQRFTEGHELMELLFDALEQTGAVPDWEHEEKERWCDQGAAELLMPRSQFVPDMQALGLSLQSGRVLADRYQTSLMATLIQMMTYGRGDYALVLWHPALRKQEQIAQEQADQNQPEKKLRVWWRYCTQDWTGGFIPPNKSVSADSLITQAYLDQQARIGTEWLPLSKSPLYCHLELLPVQTSHKSYVVSLLKALDAPAC